MSLRVGYVLKRFPRLSETFVLNEMLELERQGVEVTVFALLRPSDEPRHELLGALKAKVHHLSGGSALDGVLVRCGTGTDPGKKQPITGLLPTTGHDFGPLFAGREIAETVQRHLQAAALAALARGSGLDHLHAHFATDATTVTLLAARLVGLPFSFTAHARDIWRTYTDPATDTAARRLKIAEAAFVATVSEHNAAHLRGLAAPADRGRIRRLYNGVDLARFHPPATPREPDLFLAVGRLIDKKGFADLAEAAARLRDQGHRFRCLLVGEGPQRGALEAAIAARGLGEELRLLGALPQEAVLDLMRRATAFVLPCRIVDDGDRDGLPTVLLEALASGLPAISTAVAGIPEIIEDGRTGLLVPERDPAALAAAMRRILDPGPRRELAAQGRAKAEAAFDLARNVAVLRQWFEAVVAMPAGRRDTHAHRLRLG